MKFKHIFLLFFIGIIVNTQQIFAQESTDEIIERVEFLLQNDRFDDALVMLDAALKKDPKNAKLHYKKATCYIGMAKYKDATKSLEAAVKADPNYFEAYERLGDMYYQFRNAPKAVEYYDKAFQTDDDIENKLKYKFEIITTLFAVKKQRFAGKHIEDAKKIFPGADQIFDLQYFESVYLNTIGEYQKALDILKNIITLDLAKKGNEKYFYELGYSYFQTGDYKKAEVTFKHADGGEFRNKIRQFTPQYFLALANTYYTILDYDRADEYLTIALKIQPTFTEGYELQKRLAVARASKAKEIEIEEKLIKAEKDPKALIERHRQLAYLLFQNGDFAHAITSADEYLAKNNRDLNMIFLKAICEYKMSQAQEATTDLAKAVNIPKMPPKLKAQFYFALGLIYKTVEKYDDAEKAFQKSYRGSFKAAAGREMQDIFNIRQQLELEKSGQ